MGLTSLSRSNVRKTCWNLYVWKQTILMEQTIWNQFSTQTGSGCPILLQAFPMTVKMFASWACFYQSGQVIDSLSQFWGDY